MLEEEAVGLTMSGPSVTVVLDCVISSVNGLCWYKKLQQDSVHTK